jgi:hypothetical protein
MAASSVSLAPSSTVSYVRTTMPAEKTALSSYEIAGKLIANANGSDNREQKLRLLTLAISEAKRAQGCFITIYTNIQGSQTKGLQTKESPTRESTVMEGSDIRARQIAAYMLKTGCEAKIIENTFARNGISIKIKDTKPYIYGPFLFANVEYGRGK